MVFAQVAASAWGSGADAIPRITLPAHRLAAFLHKSSTDSCTEKVSQQDSAGLVGRRRNCPQALRDTASARAGWQRHAEARSASLYPHAGNWQPLISGQRGLLWVRTSARSVFMPGRSDSSRPACPPQQRGSDTDRLCITGSERIGSARSQSREREPVPDAVVGLVTRHQASQRGQVPNWAPTPGLPGWRAGPAACGRRRDAVNLLAPGTWAGCRRKRIDVPETVFARAFYAAHQILQEVLGEPQPAGRRAAPPSMGAATWSRMVDASGALLR